MFIELHFLQSFVPSSLNRDDANMPKDCEFGGVRRARISSQCLKRAIRLHPLFTLHSGVPSSQRTRLMVKELTERLVSAGKSETDSKEHAEEYARFYSSKKGKLDGTKTGVMLFLGMAELDEIVAKLIRAENWQNKMNIKNLAETFAKDTKKRSGAPDIALFGRMLAERPETNVDAACQVAHAISTHRVRTEVDFFTAVDDLNQGERSAGLIGVTNFNSACFYRYACIDFKQLLINLGDDVELAKKTVEAFLRASVAAVPGGKQNSFAAQNFPSFLMAVTRSDGMCWSLANAFEQPIIAAQDRGLLRPSIEKLDEYWGLMHKLYGGETHPVVALLEGGLELNNLKDVRVESLEEWIIKIMSTLPKD